MKFVSKVIVLLAITVSGFANPSYPKDYYPPVLSTTAIIEIYEDGQELGVVLIERGKEPFGLALPGGKVEYGETVDEAIRREMQEEVNLELHELQQFHVYSDPKRDPRHHTVEVTHTAKAYRKPKAGDDAAKAFIFPLNAIPWEKLTFDHAKILRDYMHHCTETAMLNP